MVGTTALAGGHGACGRTVRRRRTGWERPSFPFTGDPAAGIRRAAEQWCATERLRVGRALPDDDRVAYDAVEEVAAGVDGDGVGLGGAGAVGGPGQQRLRP